MWNILLHAVVLGDESMVIEILNTDSTRVYNLNGCEEDESYLMHRVAGCGAGELATLLILSGADLNRRSNLGSTPLHEAVAGGQTEIAKLLIENGADLNARNIMGFTPLEWAGISGNREAIRALRLAGAKE